MFNATIERKLKDYADSLNKDILIDICINDQVSNIIHTIYSEAIRTYNEDLYRHENKHFKDCEHIEETFVTEDFRYNPDDVFWKRYIIDPFEVDIVIDNKLSDSEIDWENHNKLEHSLSLDPENEKII